MQDNYIIAHIADIHIRFGSRHHEYKTVLKRTVEDVKKIKPKRITLLGDLFHIKINLSPTAVEIAGTFLKELSKIAPVDIILGNHDINLQSMAQGNAVEPIVELLENGFVLEKEQELPVAPRGQNGIYFFKHSGYYNITEELVYGVYSCFDNEILSLTKKDPNKTYVALFHGPVYGCLSDNGYEMKGDDITKLATFNNFDVVLMGDIHEYQEFERENGVTALYPGSCPQQNMGESLNKGYVVWNLKDLSHERRFIPNDYGFSKINISIGELWEERVNDLKFSLDKKKTKVEIILEEYEENYSVEKLAQVERYVKDRFGCENVSADYKVIKREVEKTEIDTEEINVNNAEDNEKILIEFLKENNFENTEDVLSLNKEIDAKINYKPAPTLGSRIEYNKLEISNVLSFPIETTEIDFDVLKGVTGIFGENYNGKSNAIKVFVWVLYGKMLGDGENHRLINMYTGSTKGWGRVYFKIGGVRYMAYREVNVKTKKDGTPDVSYKIEYKVEKVVIDDFGKTITAWENVDSDEAATEKKEKKKLIVDYIGTYEDFTKVALQGGKEDYLSLSQQPKNDLVNKFLGLEIYRDRYDAANETFKTIKAKQKFLGDPEELKKNIEDTNKTINDETLSLTILTREKDDNNYKIEELGKEILELTKKVHKIEIPKENKEILDSRIEKSNLEIKNNESEIKVTEEWLSINSKKELSEELINVDTATIQSSLEVENLKFTKEKNEYVNLEAWLKTTTKKEVVENIELKDIDLPGKNDCIVLERWLSENNKKEVVENIEIKDIKLSGKNDYLVLEKWLVENTKKIEVDTKPIDEKISKIKESLLELGNQLKISKGESCPTCGNVSKAANKELEEKCINNIGRGNIALKEQQQLLVDAKQIIDDNNEIEKKSIQLEKLKNELIQKYKEEISEHNNKIEKEINRLEKLKNELIQKYKEGISEHNNKIEKESLKLESLKVSLAACNNLRKELTAKLELCSKKEEIIKHNNEVDKKTKELSVLRTNIDVLNKKINEFAADLALIEKNKLFVEQNLITNEKISVKQEDIKVYKTLNLQVDSKIKEINGNLRVYQNNLELYTQKLNDILETDRIYKKYSIYLQAMDKDGIPAIIIRKKLPIINHKINSLLRGMVKFKAEIFVKPNGDVKEVFYYSDTKTDTLPLSMGSGSQKFLTSVAIRDSLHFVSSLVKPSFCAIDEGFDTLSNTKLTELGNMFDYLRDKYKNVFVITHKSEIKDYVDNVIEVLKVKDGVKTDVINNPEAGITRLKFGK